MLFIVIELLILVICFWYFAFIIESTRNLRKGRIVYYGSDLGEQGQHLERLIQKYIPNTKKFYLLEPGAGLAKVADFLSRRFHWREIIAIEIGPVILGIAKLRATFRSQKIRFIRHDILHYSFPTPAVIYCYLTTEILDVLYKQGQLNGSLVITLTFPITGVKATETVALKSWQKQILVYDFR